MKQMSDSKMDMKRAEPDSNSYFPEESHSRALPKSSEIRGFKYPDKEEMIHRDQQSAINAASKNLPKEGFRH
jgi:hypothetical protein